MRDLNKMELIGSVSQEIRVNQSAKGLAIANIPVSTKVVRQSGQEISTYHTIVCFGELAEMASTFKVGDRVFATGSIQNESYEKDGQKRYVTKVKATHLAKLAAEAEDKPAQEAPKGGNTANFPRGETSKPAGFPFYDTERQVTWAAPNKDGNGCSPVVEKSGLFMTCRWENPEDPLCGGVVYGMKDGEDTWNTLGNIPSTVNIPF
jgi:single-strand DNA-binding protein